MSNKSVIGMAQSSRTSPIACVRCALTRINKTSLVTSVVSIIASNPAFALVDERLNGDGTGKALGINDPILGWVILGVFTTVWAVYFTATKELGGQREEDGLGL